MMRHILLATDLTARSDRAVDRAVRLAHSTGAQLTVVHAVEDQKGIREEVNIPSWRSQKPGWQRLDRLIEAAGSEIRAQIGALDHAAEVIVREGSAPDLVTRQMQERRFDLLVTGVARDTGQGRVVLGSTVERSIKSGLAPVLVVKRRPLAPYERVVVATDFSQASSRALDVTLDLCPGVTIDLLHAYETEEEGMSAHLLGEDDPAYRHVRAEANAFLNRQRDGERLRTILEPGQPLSLLNSYAADHGVDLVAIGTHGRTGFLARLFGSVAERVLLSAPCDVLVAGELGTRRPI
ncbi:universal stress protein [Aureimonas mangrovi]|uniref:universal stress protein n=1 Tax=Aureimonas mangrovi TaxID=2758041 RepID=UPI00163D9298|nr:universal stress protein [Aureimonas mangrovi]